MKTIHEPMLRRGVGAKRPLLRANEEQMLGQRGFLLAAVCVPQHIPLHLLHVSALLGLLAGPDGNMRNPFALL